jgi:hypothetical protein
VAITPLGAVASYAGTATTSIAATLPSGIVAGTLLKAIIAVDGLFEFVIAPLGWSIDCQYVTTQGNRRVYAKASRVSDGTDGSTATFSSDANHIMGVVVAGWNGVDVTVDNYWAGERDFTVSNPDLSSQPLSPVTLTASSVNALAGDQLVFMGGADSNGNSGVFTAPSGFGTVVQIASTNTLVALMMAEKTASAGATGSVSATWTQSGINANFLTFFFVLKATPAPTLTAQPVQLAQASFPQNTADLAPASFPSACTAGNLIFYVAYFDDSFTGDPRPAFTLSDTLKNTYNKIGALWDSVNLRLVEIGYAKNIAGGANALQMLAPGSAYKAVLAWEWAGLDTGNPYTPGEWSAANSLNTGICDSGATPALSAQPAIAIALNVMMHAGVSGKTFSPGQGFTPQGDGFWDFGVSLNIAGALAYKRLSAVNPVNGVFFSSNGGISIDTFVAVFRLPPAVYPNELQSGQRSPLSHGNSMLLDTREWW